MKDNWIPCEERLPERTGKYLVTVKFSSRFPPEVGTAYFSTNLYKVDWHDFPDKKGEAGFYTYDCEWGYSELTDVTAWQKMPEPYIEVGE